MKDSKIRFQKHLSECGIASRRKSEELIEEGRVKVKTAFSNCIRFFYSSVCLSS